MRTLFIIASFFLALCRLDAASPSLRYPIIPKPKKLIQADGRCRLHSPLQVTCEIEELKEFASYCFQCKEHDGAKLALILAPDQKIKPEGYRLEIMPAGITVTASDADGLFWGVQTLRQLRVGNGLDFPCCTIEDCPAFSYRGMHLDVVRHFFPVSFIKQYIDIISYYKFNTFHWHLTDDQGWRIEIKRYPELQKVAANRHETLVGHNNSFPKKYDKRVYGGFYTQDEIREVVAYAKERHITIIPEIEMPGHARAALAAYPELGCTGGPYKVATRWGIFEDVFCAGNDATFTFLEGVLTEVMELFPGEYIHIGGDEAPKKRWAGCLKCQKRIKQEGLKDEETLQSYFIYRIEKFLNSHGRTIIGWDEILEGGLAPNATVMSWRGTKGGIRAAELGHNVIMTPDTHLYFDHYQLLDPDGPLAIGGYTPLEKVYEFNPVPKGIDKKYILGAQANVWTEYMPTQADVLRMAFPRGLALAECLWTPKNSKNFYDFRVRLDRHRKP